MSYNACDDLFRKTSGNFATIPNMFMISRHASLAYVPMPWFAGNCQTSSPRVESFSLPMVDDGPSSKRQVEWGRFLRELGAEIPVLQDFAGEEAMEWGGALGITDGVGHFYFHLTRCFSGISSVGRVRRFGGLMHKCLDPLVAWGNL